MASSPPKVPTNKKEEANYEKALSTYREGRVQAVKDFLEGDVTQAFMDGLEAVLEEGLPTGYSTAVNFEQIAAAVTRCKTGIQADLMMFQLQANPLPAPSVPPYMPSPPLV